MFFHNINNSLLCFLSETGNSSKGAAVLLKPTAASKVQKKKEKYDKPVTNLQLPSTSSVVSFCESLSADLQTLTADQQMKCRIDILMLIKKYKNSKNDRKAGVENDQCNIAVSDVSKKFAVISEKLSKGNMSSFDEDWFWILGVNNFFGQLMDLRKTNVELDRLLQSYKSIDSTKDMNDAEKQVNFKAPSVFESQNNLMDSIADAAENKQDPSYEVDPFFDEGDEIMEPFIKTEPKHSDESRFFPAGDTSIVTQENIKREAETHDTLKKLDLSEGMMQVDRNRFICILCDSISSANFYSHHTIEPFHVYLMKDYSTKSANIKNDVLPQLNTSVYQFQFGGLYCLKCRVQMLNRSDFSSHTRSLKHKKQLQILSISIDQEMFKERDVGIVHVNKCNYCVLCDVKIFGSPSMHTISPSHKKVIALLEGVFKMSPTHGYCTHCNEAFLLSTLDLHTSQEEHISKVMTEQGTIL